MNKGKYIFFIVLTSIFLSCDKDSKCLKTAGSQSVDQRTIPSSIEFIELNNKINLYIKQDSVPSLKVAGGSNLLSMISTEVNGNKLTIKSDNRCDFLRSYNENIDVFISIPNLKKIRYNGQGDISSVNTLDFPEFEMETYKATGSIKLALISNTVKLMQHTGPADFELIGSAQKLYLYTIGNGWFHLEKFITQETHVNTSGTGDVIVNSNLSLLVELYAIGNVYYYGNPTVTISQHTGSGEVKKR